MATKAQQKKAEDQRNANPPKPKAPKRPRRDVDVDTAKKGVSASDRKAGAGKTATRNTSKRVAKKGGPVLEDSETGKPSRKSTRKTTGGGKPASALKRKVVRKTTSAKARATRSTVGRTSKVGGKKTPAVRARKTARKAPTRKAPARRK